MDSAPLLGRESELLEILRFFTSSARLVTLWGTGGIGKTRIASEYQTQREQEGQQVRFCDLSSCHSVAALCGVVAASMHLPISPSEGDVECCESIGRALCHGGIDLLILDNCEQLPEAVSQAAGLWLRAYRHLRILVTSRERLRITHEHILEVPPLKLPDTETFVADSPAVQLFVRQAQLTQSDFCIDDGNSQAVASLVTKLDGIPLAIELAASHINTFGIAGLLSHIREQLDLLRGPRDSPTRQATLRSTISWSWQLLSENEKRVLAESARFRGGFPLRAALRVLTREDNTLATLDTLQSLRDKSMLRAEQGTSAIRFFHYNSIRLFAKSTSYYCDDEGSLKAYLDYYVELASTCTIKIEERGCSVSVRELSEERHNLQKSLQLVLGTPATKERASEVLVLTLALSVILTAEGPFDSLLSILNVSLQYAEGQDVSTNLLNRTYRSRGNTQRILGQLSLAEEDFGLAQSKYLEGAKAETWADFGVLFHQKRELQRSEDFYNRALESADALTNARTVARVLGNLAALAHDKGELQNAERRYREAIAALRKVGDQRLEGIFLANLSIVEMEELKFEEARIHVMQAYSTLKSLGDRRLMGVTLGTIAALDHAGGHVEDAIAGFRGAIQIMREIGELRSLALSLGRLGAVLASTDQIDLARQRIDESERILEQIGDGTAREAMGLSRLFIDLASAVQAKIDGRDAESSEIVVAIKQGIESAYCGFPALTERSDDARSLLRILEESLAQFAAAELPKEHMHQLVVGPYANWFRAKGGTWQDLRRRAPMRNILLALVRQRHREPRSTLALTSLQEAGWPNESIQPESAANRVYVALNKLRKLGLNKAIMTTETGYLIDPDLEVRRNMLDWRVLS